MDLLLANGFANVVERGRWRRPQLCDVAVYFVELLLHHVDFALNHLDVELSLAEFNNPGIVLYFDSIRGDANGDGTVDETDAQALAANWGQPGDWSAGDFTGDGIVNAADASILAANWGYGTSESNTGTAPEPNIAVMLLIGVSTLWARRGRQSESLPL